MILKQNKICQFALLNIATAAKQFEEACTINGQYKIDRTVQGEGIVYTYDQIDAIYAMTYELFMADPKSKSYTLPKELRTLVAQRPYLRQSTVLDMANFVNDLMQQNQIS